MKLIPHTSDISKKKLFLITDNVTMSNALHHHALDDTAGLLMLLFERIGMPFPILRLTE